MEARIQQVLDEQWDALEARSPRVRSVRHQLALLLDEFAAQKQQESSVLETSITNAQAQLHEIQQAEKTRNDIQKQLETELAAPLAQELSTLSAEVENLDKQILELKKRRAEANQRRHEVASIVASRTAKFHYALADLNRKNPPDDADKVHGLQSQLGRLNQQKHGVDAESKAAQGGQDMWQQVCRELDLLDGDIRGLKRDHLDRISFLLKRKTILLENLAQDAHDNGWTVIVVAIGHELQILNEALKALNKAEHTSD